MKFMNIEDLKGCPICGAKCACVSIECNEHAFVCGERMGIYKGTFECVMCGSTINLCGDSAMQVLEKWNDLARK